MAGRIRNPATSQRVLEYLRDHANTDIPQTEIKAALNLQDSMVSNAVVHLRSKGIHVERPMRGIYRYVTGPHTAPEPEPAPQKYYEYVGTSGGIDIVRGEDEQLYVVTALVEFVTRQP